MQVCLCVLHACLRGHICMLQECRAVHFVASPSLILQTEISSRGDEFFPPPKAQHRLILTLRLPAGRLAGRSLRSSFRVYLSRL